ncbi:MAG: AAA family ATPase, partial [Limnoraphis sp.]
MSEKQEEFLFTEEMFEHLSFIEQHPKIEEEEYTSSLKRDLEKIESILEDLSNIALIFFENSLHKYQNLKSHRAKKTSDNFNKYIFISEKDYKGVKVQFELKLISKSLNLRMIIMFKNGHKQIDFLQLYQSIIINNDSIKHILKDKIEECQNELTKKIQENNYNSWVSFSLKKIINFQEACKIDSEKFIVYLDEIFQKILPLILISLPQEPIFYIYKYFNVQLPYSLSECANDTGFQEQQLEGWVKRTKKKKQVIFQGPPGTGKTFITKKIAKHIIADTDGFSELVQFHPAYTYEDFMLGIRPDTKDGQLTYSMVPGRFIEFCKKAASCEGNCVLIIDEINRANLSQVFGELMYLLEYRREKICLAGSNEPFGIPPN